MGIDPTWVIRRGGPSTERLYEFDAEFGLPDGRQVVVAKSQMPKASLGMEDVFVRNKARYGWVMLFCRPGCRLLDFPCGCGYAAQILCDTGITYEGCDCDEPTIEYARRFYGKYNATFRVDDLGNPDIGRESYDIIACVEGIEHIPGEYHQQLIKAFFEGLKPGGVLLVSSPEPVDHRSGPSSHNPDHLFELTKEDFRSLLSCVFGESNVEMVSQRNIVLSTGARTTCQYAVCHRE